MGAGAFDLTNLMLSFVAFSALPAILTTSRVAGPGLPGTFVTPKDTRVRALNDGRRHQERSGRSCCASPAAQTASGRSAGRTSTSSTRQPV
jgi:hypothetical protein